MDGDERAGRGGGGDVRAKITAMKSEKWKTAWDLQMLIF